MTIVFFANFRGIEIKINLCAGPELNFENYESVQHRLQFSGIKKGAKISFHRHLSSFQIFRQIERIRLISFLHQVDSPIVPAMIAALRTRSLKCIEYLKGSNIYSPPQDMDHFGCRSKTGLSTRLKSHFQISVGEKRKRTWTVMSDAFNDRYLIYTLSPLNLS